MAVKPVRPKAPATSPARPAAKKPVPAPKPAATKKPALVTVKKQPVAAKPPVKQSRPPKKQAAPAKKPPPAPVKKQAAPVKQAAPAKKPPPAPVKKQAAPVKQAAPAKKPPPAPVKKQAAPVKRAAPAKKPPPAPVKKQAAPVKQAVPAKMHAAPVKAPKPVVAKAPPRPKTPPPPAYMVALAKVAQRPQPSFNQDDITALEQAFGWRFPDEARKALAALGTYDLLAGVGRVLTLAEMRRYSGMDPTAFPDAVGWTTRRLGLLPVAVDAQDNRFCIDVGDPRGTGPVYIASPKHGLAAGSTTVFPQATDLVHAYALYTAGKDARDAEADVVRLTAALKELRQRRPAPLAGRNEALARLESAFGGARKPDAAPAPGAEEESRLARELEDANQRYKTLWMPFVEQFARWPLYWNLLWNGPGALNAVPAQDSPLMRAWREALPLGQAAVLNRMEQLSTELQNRQPLGRAALAVAEARRLLGDAAGVETALSAWNAGELGPLPPLVQGASTPAGAAPVPSKADLDWAKALKLSKVKTEKFLAAVGAQLAADLQRHGTANVLGATKAAVRPAGGGRMLVEGGLGHVPLEVRKALFESKPVTLSGQFLKGLARDLCRRLHEPRASVEKTLTRLRNVLQDHINARANLTIPHVGSFRVKNEPSPTGAARLYLIMDAAPNLVEAAQSAILHTVSPGFAAEEESVPSSQ